jgi:hypothetical protein
MQIDELIQQFAKVTEDITKLGVENIPYYAEKFLVEVWLRVLNSLYSPKQIFHNLALVAAIQALVVSIQFINNATHQIIMKFTTKGRLERILLDQLSSANSYCEWRDVATQLDELKGLNIWRSIDVSSLYDSSTVAKRISGTVDMLNSGDAFNLMFRLRGGLARDQFGVQHSGLFSRAMAGTKHIVERYHEAVASALCFICDTNDADVKILIPQLLQLLVFNDRFPRMPSWRSSMRPDTPMGERPCCKSQLVCDAACLVITLLLLPSLLRLSGGGYLGYYHMGVVKALWTQVMLPRVISGSSAGSIMTAIIGLDWLILLS